MTASTAGQTGPSRHGETRCSTSARPSPAPALGCARVRAPSRSLVGPGAQTSGSGFAVEEGQEHEAPARGHVQYFVQVRAGEDERRAWLGSIELIAILRKAQLSAIVAVVEIQGEREHPVRRGWRQVVAMRPEEAAGGCVVTGDLESLEAGRAQCGRKVAYTCHPGARRTSVRFLC